MTATETVMLIVNLLALTATGLFIAAYSRVRWWVTATGQNVMAVGIVMASLLTVGVLRRFGSPAADPLTLITHTAAIVVMAWRTALLWQAQHERDHTDRTED